MSWLRSFYFRLFPCKHRETIDQIASVRSIPTRLVICTKCKELVDVEEMNENYRP